MTLDEFDSDRHDHLTIGGMMAAACAGRPEGYLLKLAVKGVNF